MTTAQEEAFHDLLTACELFEKWMLCGQPGPYSDSQILEIVHRAIVKAKSGGGSEALANDPLEKKLKLLTDIGDRAKEIVSSEDGGSELDMFVLSIAERYEELTQKPSGGSKEVKSDR